MQQQQEPPVMLPAAFARALLEYLLDRPCREAMGAVQALTAAIEQSKNVEASP
jgi:hypothetical protein